MPVADLPGSSLLSEIMPMIYKRFTDKSAEEWRQIYKVSTWLTALELNKGIDKSLLSRHFSYSSS